jgi:hypothetical protein
MKRVLGLSLLLMLILTFSGCSDSDKSKETDSFTGSGTVVNGNYWGRHNGDRPHWYYPARFRDYPNEFYLTIAGCTTDLKVVSKAGSRWESSGYLVKQSDVSGRGMVVLGPSSCRSRVSFIEY